MSHPAGEPAYSEPIPASGPATAPRGPAAPIDVIRDAHAAHAILHPLRQRILAALDVPDSATGLARRLDLPRQKVNYHLRELEAGGLVELVEQRRRGNCIERLVRATARSYVISPEVMGELGRTTDEAQDRFSSAYQLAVAAGVLRDVSVLRRRAAALDQALPTLTVSTDVRFATAADRDAAAEELSRFLMRLAAQYHDDEAPGGRHYRFVIAAHPTVTKTEADAAREARRARAASAEGDPQ